MTDSGVVNIHGKEYLTVAKRIDVFRRVHTDYCILTELVENTQHRVVMKASIFDAAHNLLSSGFAEEVRAASQINKTSALENCETSAIGRALAFLGYGGSQIASADEVKNAIHQQEADTPAFRKAYKALEKAANSGTEAFRIQWKGTSKVQRDRITEGQIAGLKEIAESADYANMESVGAEDATA